MQEQLDRIEAKLDLLLDNAGKESPAPAVDVETGEIWPDWYADLYSIPGFKKQLTQCQDWLDTLNITDARANETAAALKGSWNGKKYKDPWATFRAWVQRPALNGANVPVVAPVMSDGEVKQAYLNDYERRWGTG
jgi:hypothetical protein